jgi:short-subunit dehydrogenase
MRIAGSRAVVTGASSGIGRAVALRLARLGADVALVARGADALEKVAEEARRHGSRIVVIPCDVADPEAVARAHRAVEADLGPPDILVNAAGFGVWKPFLDIAVEEHTAMMEVMYWGAFRWIRAVLPGMVARRHGHVVNISAGSGRFALPVTSGFSAAAFALSGLSEALHRELLGSPVGVSCLHPGSVRTGFWSEARQPRRSIPPLVRYSPKL